MKLIVEGGRSVREVSRERPTKDLVFDALLKGLRTRRPGAGLIFHSDRGAQYASLEVRNVLRHWRARQSMSGKGSCFDNAVMESFFSSLKRELVYLETFHTKAEAQQSVFEYIETFSNRRRRHSALNFRTPLEYYREANQAL